MSLNILIVKTGSTIPSLKSQGVDFEDWFLAGLGIEATEMSVCDPTLGEPLPDITGVSGIIITGSPAYVTDEADWNFTIADYCKDAHFKQIPILGVCYGHQLLAWAFGGKVGFNPNGREIGSTDVQLSEYAATDQLFTHQPRDLHVQVSHLQSVLELPTEAVLLASNDFDKHHAFRLGDYTWGIQFHPEFNDQITKAYITERAADIDKEGLDSTKLFKAVGETSQSTTLLPRFVEITRSV